MPECMVTSNEQSPIHNLQIGDVHIKQVMKFKYLAGVLTNMENLTSKSGLTKVVFEKQNKVLEKRRKNVRNKAKECWMAM